MAFQCSLDRLRHVSDAGETEVPEGELDSYDVLIIYACRLLAGTGAKFHLGGFGSDDWNLDISYDCSVFMEQYPDLMQALGAGQEFQLDLYSQGVERALIFEPHRDLMQIRCISGTSSFVPDPDVETMPLPDAEAMLTRLGRDFVDSVRAVSAPLAEMQPFPRWLEG
jgi:hypothetical protein